MWWWTGYGISAAAFGFTHYYAFFALAAQGLFAVIFLLARARKGGWRQVRNQAAWFVYALVLGGLLYAPWLPVLMGQTADVRAGFWIGEVGLHQVERVFWPWCTGLIYPDFWEKTAWLVVLFLSLGWTLYQRSPAGCFFLLQAALPWLFSLGLSLLWQRAIFYDRYCFRCEKACGTYLP